MIKPKFPVAHTPSKQGKKKWHRLHHHHQKVGGRARKASQAFGAAQIGHILGLIHDLGKYHPNFQRYLEQHHAIDQKVSYEKPQRFPHAIYGARLIWEYGSSDLRNLLALILKGHHTGLYQLQEIANDFQGDQFRDTEREENYQEILVQAQADVGSGWTDLLQSIRDLSFDQTLLSNEFSKDLFGRMLFSALIDADRLDAEIHQKPDQAKLRRPIALKKLVDVFNAKQELFISQKVIPLHVSEQTRLLNQVRSEVYNQCVQSAENEPGIFRLMVPTGGGKTRSGLAFGLNHARKNGLERVIVAVPYTSIIEQTVKVYQDIFRSALGDRAVLEHHSAMREENYRGADKSTELWTQVRLASENWDAPLVVTTTVQLLESLLSNRPNRCRKIHNIANSVIILDEVQALPLGLRDPVVSVLKELVEHYNVSVVLCTATQLPLEINNNDLRGFELGKIQPIVPPAMAQKHFAMIQRVKYDLNFGTAWTWEQLVDHLQANCQQHEHQQALIILNTRRDALAVVDAVQAQFKLPNGDKLPEDAIFHLSTLLCGAHRRRVLWQVRRRLRAKQPCILISTQVVEAGVDLDFPLVYRALAPLDRIVQAAGRCNREFTRDAEASQVVIFKGGKVPPDSAYRTAIDQAESLLKRARYRQQLDTNDPELFERYFREVYKGVPPDTENVQTYRKEMDYGEVASRFRLIKDDTTPLIVKYYSNKGQRLIEKLQQQARRFGDFKIDYRKLQPYIVNLRHREFEKAKSEHLCEELAPGTGVWVWTGNYDRVLKGILRGDDAIPYSDPADLIC
jgi:CRISPR-associated endonuclease/helicase Cas3